MPRKRTRKDGLTDDEFAMGIIGLAALFAAATSIAERKGGIHMQGYSYGILCSTCETENRMTEKNVGTTEKSAHVPDRTKLNPHITFHGVIHLLTHIDQYASIYLDEETMLDTNLTSVKSDMELVTFAQKHRGHVMLPTRGDGTTPVDDTVKNLLIDASDNYRLYSVDASNNGSVGNAISSICSKIDMFLASLYTMSLRKELGRADRLTIFYKKRSAIKILKNARDKILDAESLLIEIYGKNM